MFQVSVRPYVVNHAVTPPTFPTHNPHVEALASDSPENGMAELAGGEEDKDNILNVNICQVSLWTEWKLVMNISESIQCGNDLNRFWSGLRVGLQLLCCSGVLCSVNTPILN